MNSKDLERWYATKSHVPPPSEQERLKQAQAEARSAFQGNGGNVGGDIHGGRYVGEGADADEQEKTLRRLGLLALIALAAVLAGCCLGTNKPNERINA